MSIAFTVSWPFVAAFVSTILAWVWCFGQDYSGDYNFSAVFTIPVAAFWTALTWMIYFAARVYIGF